MEHQRILSLMLHFDRNHELVFQFRLAMDLGMTVHELRRVMPFWELVMWEQFYKRERIEIKRIHDKAKRKSNGA